MRFRFSLSLAALLALQPGAWACTTLMVTAKDGSVVSGRTMEFGFDVQSEVLVIPSGTTLSGTLPNNAKGLTYTTKYAMAGANAFGYQVLVDGINEKGLFVSSLYFPGFADYPAMNAENAARGLAPQEYGAWLLGNFATVAEVREHAQDVTLLPTVVPVLGAAAPLHFIIRDRTGQALVVEPVGGKLHVFENPVGVLTNSPSFDWHLTNLRNYIGLSEHNHPQLTLAGGYKLTQFGQGNGMVGLPGDTTPPARFVRAVAFSQTALPTKTADEAVVQAFHLMNQFDTPLGSVQDKDGNTVQAEYTVWTSVADLKNDRWYFRTYNDQTIRMVDLKKAAAMAAGQIRTIKMDSRQTGEDVSTRFTE